MASVEVLSTVLGKHRQVAPQPSQFFTYIESKSTELCLGPQKAPSWGQAAAGKVLQGAVLRVSHSGLRRRLVLLAEIVAKCENTQ